VRAAAGERGEGEQRDGWRFVVVDLSGGAHGGEQLAGGWGDQLDVVVRAEHDESGRGAVGGPPGCVEAQ
jgi:hypothetical protein